MTSSGAETDAPKSAKGISALKWTVLVAAASALVAAFFLFDVNERLREFLDWVESLGAAGTAIFLAVYIVATVLMVPGSILTIGAGSLFGVVWGSIWVSIASTIGASAAFLIGRYAARDWVSARIAGSERFKAIDEAVGRQGWKIVGLARLSPIFPFALLNYAFGLTRVRFWHYVVASWVGMMPGTIMYVYLGSIPKAASEGGKTAGEWVLYGVGLAATVLVTIVITRTAKKALKATIEG